MLATIISRLTGSTDTRAQQASTKSSDSTVEDEREEMSVTVKAFLKKSGAGLTDFAEIRRIPVSVKNVEDYQFLVQKIKSAFPSLANKTIQLSYKDHDDDLITFSSDEELREGLLTEADGVFKVYIEAKGDETPKENSGNSGGVLHPCVTCDGCEGEVRGIRYKCAVCPDYDLCEACKGRGLHPEHQFTDIRTPVARSFFPPPFGMPGPPPFCFPQPGGPGMPPFFHGGPGGRDEMRLQRRAWRRWMKAMSGASPCGKTWKKEKKDEKHEEKKARKAEKKARKEKERAERAETSEQSGTQKVNDKDTSSSSSSSDEGEGSPTGDYLKSVGQSVAAMLDPLGIDVEIDVEHKGRKKHCHRGFHGGPWGMHMRGGFGGPGWGGRGGGGRGGFWRMGGPFGGCGFNQAGGHPSAAYGAPPHPHAQYPHHPPPPPPPNAPYPHPPPQYPHDMDTNSETGELRSGVQTPGCCVFADPFSKGGEADKSAKISVSVEPNGWTLVADIEGADVEGAAKGVENLKMAGQDCCDGADPPRSMDQRMVEALDKMMSMGYTDSDGWLTTLLVDNNCDIGRTLDAILNKK